MIGIPELLAPAGNMEKLKVAFAWCRCCIYGGKRFGLRAFADNFTPEEIKKVLISPIE